MRIRMLTAYLVRLPLKRPFRHASTTRRDSENVLVRSELADGTTGWGEGVPRRYVTGETPEGCLAQLAATPVAEQLADDCRSWADVIALCEQFRPAARQPDPRKCYSNALRCAVELSLLDAFGRLFNEPVARVVDHFGPAQSIKTTLPRVQYSAAIDSGNRGLVRKSLIRRIYGFGQCKIKVGAAGDDDPGRLATIRRWIGPHMDLRLDANEAWHASEVCEKLAPLLPFGVSCIEQPVPHAEVAQLAGLRGKLGVPVMLDESLTSEVDARAAIEARSCELFNIRLSKCGGFLASLRLAALAAAAGYAIQLGCHPGESGILSAAGRHWACRVKDIRYCEGSYDHHLFRKLLTYEDVTFARGGWAPAIDRPGLGVTVNPAVLRDVTLREQAFGIN